MADDRRFARELRAAIEAEIEAPGDPQALCERLEARLGPACRPVVRLLSAKDRLTREALEIDGEVRAFRRFGWTSSKVLMILVLLVAFAVAILPGRLTGERATLLIFGASAYYFVLYVAALLGQRGLVARSRAARDRYRAALREVLAGLEGPGPGPGPGSPESPR